MCVFFEIKKIIIFEKTNKSPDKLNDFDTSNVGLSSAIGIPNVIYASRTHTQIQQVIQELKRTAYK